jgi:hypothetical protein
MSSHVDTNIKSKSNSNAHHEESYSVHMNNLSKRRKNRRTSNVSIGFDVSASRKFRIIMYSAYLLVELFEIYFL